MGKKSSPSSVSFDELRTFPIKKNKSFLKNLNLFLLEVKKQHPLATHQFIYLVHYYVYRCAKTYKISQKQFQSVLQKVKICSKCDQVLQQACAECGKCEDYYHFECAKSSLQNSICQYCQQKTNPQSKIQSMESQVSINESSPAQLTLINRLIPKAKQTFFHLFPSMTVEQIETYKTQLLQAIKQKKMNYVEELQPMDCDIEINFHTSLDFGIQKLCASDQKLFKAYKDQPIGPFLFEYQEGMGFNIKADKDLPSSMIVCEYVGEVYSHREVAHRFSLNNSLMELRNGKNANQRLFIVPQKKTNIGRFFNGVNNKKSWMKGNLSSMKVLLKNKPVIILYTNRPIVRGETLLYNYNAGTAKVHIDTSEYF